MRIITSIAQETIDASCDLPPTVCCMRDLERDAVNGIQEKNDPTTFPIP